MSGGNANDAHDDRRQYKRVHAPVYCRPVGLALRFLNGDKRKAEDISLGGMRIYADEEPKRGARLELELFMPDGRSVTCRVEVVWVDPLPAGAPAKFDVGLKYTEIRDEDRARLSVVLDEA